MMKEKGRFQETKTMVLLNESIGFVE